MAEVVIVGAGAAGMAAATRLLEQGFDVRLLEQNDFLGGKLGTHAAGEMHDPHEHCYHMYLNWYHNFWQLMEEIGTRTKWIPMPVIGCRKPGTTQTEPYLTNAGSPWSVLANLTTGVASPADMFLYSYSMLDLLGQPSGPDSRLEGTSVAGFLNSGGYGTAESMAISGRTLAEAFASPSVLSSSRSYQSLLKYGFRQPSPSMWLLTENTETGIFKPWETHLEGLARRLGRRLTIERGRRVDSLRLEGGRVVEATVSKLDVNPKTRRGGREPPQEAETIPVGDMILAVPPGSLGRLVNREIFAVAPELANVRKLRSEPMISLDVYFRRRIPGLTRSITLLLESRHNLSLLDNSQLWGNVGNTFLNVIASDADTLVEYSDDDIRDLLLQELSRFLQFKLGDLRLPADRRDDDIDYRRTHIQTNIGEELFVNQVGSWQYRPVSTCGIDNLFIAGDYCQSFVDVVTIEGAVVTGLLAAEALRARHGIGRLIEIVTPESYKPGLMAAMAGAARPMAFAAKAMSMADHGLRGAFSRMFPNG